MSEPDYIARLRYWIVQRERDPARTYTSAELLDACDLLRDYDAIKDQLHDAGVTEAILRQEITNLRVKEARLAEAERLLALAKHEHYCGPEWDPSGDCGSAFCRAVRTTDSAEADRETDSHE